MAHRYSETLRRVAPILSGLTYSREILRTIAEFERMADPYERSATEFDTAEAVYYTGMMWHGGQWSEWYGALCATEFNPGPCWNRPERNTTAADLVAALCRITATHERRQRN